MPFVSESKIPRKYKLLNLDIYIFAIGFLPVPVYFLTKTSRKNRNLFKSNIISLTLI